MKDHVLRELVNRLTKVAINQHSHECLRGVILTEVLQAINEDHEWYRAYRAVSGATGDQPGDGK